MIRVRTGGDASDLRDGRSRDARAIVEGKPHRGKNERGFNSTESAEDEAGIAHAAFVLTGRVVQAQKTIRNSALARYLRQNGCRVPLRGLNTAGSKKLGEKSSDHPTAFSF
jgi:hypothetical protein